MPNLIIYIHSSISTAIISRSEPYTLLAPCLSKATPEPPKDEKQTQKQVQKTGGRLGPEVLTAYQVNLLFISQAWSLQ